MTHTASGSHLTAIPTDTRMFSRCISVSNFAWLTIEDMTGSYCGTPSYVETAGATSIPSIHLTCRPTLSGYSPIARAILYAFSSLLYHSLMLRRTSSRNAPHRARRALLVAFSSAALLALLSPAIRPSLRGMQDRIERSAHH